MVSKSRRADQQVDNRHVRLAAAVLEPCTCPKNQTCSSYTLAGKQKCGSWRFNRTHDSAFTNSRTAMVQIPDATNCVASAGMRPTAVQYQQSNDCTDVSLTNKECVLLRTCQPCILCLETCVLGPQPRRLSVRPGNCQCAWRCGRLCCYCLCYCRYCGRGN